MSFFNRIALPLAATLAIAVALPSAAQAAECKGMSQSKCEKASQCSYVNGYKTKSGNKVAGYCRNKAKSSSSSSKDKKESSSKKEKDDKKKDDKKK